MDMICLKYLILHCSNDMLEQKVHFFFQKTGDNLSEFLELSFPFPLLGVSPPLVSTRTPILTKDFPKLPGSCSFRVSFSFSKYCLIIFEVVVAARGVNVAGERKRYRRIILLRSRRKKSFIFWIFFINMVERNMLQYFFFQNCFFFFTFYPLFLQWTWGLAWSLNDRMWCNVFIWISGIKPQNRTYQHLKSL